MRSLIGSFVNRSPVPLSATRNRSGIFTLSRGLRPLTAYGEVGTLFAIVSSLASSVASVEWTLYKTAASGIKEERTPVTDHPCIELWNKPNPFMPGQEFRETAQQHIDLVGEADLIVSTVRIGGNDIPMELWPVRPDRIKPVPDPYDFLKGYLYVSPDGEKMPLELNEVLQLKMPNPNDPYRGLGPVQAVLTDLDSAKYSAEWNRNFFENSAEPGGVIEVPVSLNDGEFERLRDQWSENHKGVKKAHRVAILENAAKWVGNSFTQRDMQFAELSVLSRDKILEVFGFPKHMLGIAEDVNRANAEAAEYLYAKYRLVNRLDRWKGMLNHELLPMYGNRGKGYEWDYESPVAENSDARNAAVTANSNALAILAEKGFDVPALLDYLGMPEIPYTKPEPKVVQLPPGQEGDGGGSNE